MSGKPEIQCFECPKKLAQDKERDRFLSDVEYVDPADAWGWDEEWPTDKPATISGPILVIETVLDSIKPKEPTPLQMMSRVIERQRRQGLV